MGIYGPRTIYCIALKDAPGCQEFVLQDDGKWLHIKETLEIGACLHSLKSYQRTQIFWLLYLRTLSAEYRRMYGAIVLLLDWVTIFSSLLWSSSMEAAVYEVQYFSSFG